MFTTTLRDPRGSPASRRAMLQPPDRPRRRRNGVSHACARSGSTGTTDTASSACWSEASAPLRQPTATIAEVVARIEALRRTRKWSAARIAFELNSERLDVSPRTVTRHLAQLGPNRRRFLDPNGESNRQPQRIVASRPGHWSTSTSRRSDGSRMAAAGASTAAAARKPRPWSKPRPKAHLVATSTCTRPSTATPGSPTPKDSMTRRPSPRSHSSNERGHGSLHTALRTSNEASPTTAPDTALESSPTLARLPPPANHAIHPTPLRQGGEIQPHPGRGVP